TENKRVEWLLPLENARTTPEDWKVLTLPAKKLADAKSFNGQLKELQIFGDAPAYLYLGEIRAIRDETPITVEPPDDRTVAVNDTVTFMAHAEGGQSLLQYEWTLLKKDEPAPTGDTLPVDSIGKA